MNKIIIVDRDDNEMGAKERSEIGHNDIYRVSALWLTNSKGEILMAQRSFNKAPDHDPGKWDPGVCGTVEKGETYNSNIVKETEEELGLKNIPLQKARKIFVNDGNHKFFAQCFTTSVDIDSKDFKIQKDEIKDVRWFTESELRNQIKNNPGMFTKSIKESVEPFMKL